MFALQGPLFENKGNHLNDFRMSHLTMSLHDEEGKLISETYDLPFDDFQYTIKYVDGKLKKGNYTLFVKESDHHYPEELNLPIEELSKAALTIF